MPRKPRFYLPGIPAHLVQRWQLLMTNHVHLLVTPQQRDSLSRTIQQVGRHYVPYVNHNYGKSGTLWEGGTRGVPFPVKSICLPACVISS